MSHHGHHNRAVTIGQEGGGWYLTPCIRCGEKKLVCCNLIISSRVGAQEGQPDRESQRKRPHSPKPKLQQKMDCRLPAPPSVCTNDIETRPAMLIKLGYIIGAMRNPLVHLLRRQRHELHHNTAACNASGTVGTT